MCIKDVEEIHRYIKNKEHSGSKYSAPQTDILDAHNGNLAGEASELGETPEAH
jgi:hypothetical protein